MSEQRANEGSKPKLWKWVRIPLIILLGAVLLLNLLWFGWRHIAYSRYDGGMTRTEMSSALFPSYAAKDEDGFDYSVKYPDYLSVTGNLAVGFSGTEENPFTDGLIIWPKLFGGYEYGVMLNSKETDSNGYMFYIDEQGNAIDEEYRPVAERYSDVIAELLSRAGNRWTLDE